MDIIGETLTLHPEDFELTSNSRNRVLRAIEAKLEYDGTEFIRHIELPYKYLPHFYATDLYKNLVRRIHPDTDISSYDYGF